MLELHDKFFLEILKKIEKVEPQLLDDKKFQKRYFEERMKCNPNYSNSLDKDVKFFLSLPLDVEIKKLVDENDTELSLVEMARQLKQNPENEETWKKIQDLLDQGYGNCLFMGLPAIEKEKQKFIEFINKFMYN